MEVLFMSERKAAMAGGKSQVSKKEMLDLLNECLEKLSCEASPVLEPKEDVCVSDALLILTKANMTITAIRGVAYMAIYSDLDENDVAEIMLVAASLMKTTIELRDLMGEMLDEAMSESDLVLDTALDAVGAAEEEVEADDEAGGGVPEPGVDQFVPLIEFLTSHNLLNDGSKVILDIEPDDGSGKRAVGLGIETPNDKPTVPVSPFSAEFFLTLNSVLRQSHLWDGPGKQHIEIFIKIVKRGNPLPFRWWEERDYPCDSI